MEVNEQIAVDHGLKKDEWEIHFGISKPGGFEKGEKTDEQLLEIIREAKQ